MTVDNSEMERRKGMVLRIEMMDQGCRRAAAVARRVVL